VNALAITLLGLERSFDRGSVPERLLAACDTAPITSSYAQQSCGVSRRVVHSRAGSTHVKGWGRGLVRSSRTSSLIHPRPLILNHTTSLPYFGIDRMGLFDRSAPPPCGNPPPAFSTGIMEAGAHGGRRALEPEAASTRRVGQGLPASRRRSSSGETGHGLSTRFAERPGVMSPGAPAVVHSVME
jgi:hypothetical protein